MMIYDHHHHHVYKNIFSHLVAYFVPFQRGLVGLGFTTPMELQMEINKLNNAINRLNNKIISDETEVLLHYIYIL